MKITNTASMDTVTCQRCNGDVPKKYAMGVGRSGNLTWTCVDCLSRYGTGEALAPLGRTVSDVQRAVTTLMLEDAIEKADQQ